jgi:hypothetical protein
VAVLGEPGIQELNAECKAYRDLAHKLQPFRLADVCLEIGAHTLVKVLSLEGKWVDGTVTQYGGKLFMSGARSFVPGDAPSSVMLHCCRRQAALERAVCWAGEADQQNDLLGRIIRASG